MSNDKHDATYGRSDHTPDVRFFDPEPSLGPQEPWHTDYHGERVRKQRGRHVARRKRPPLLARIAAAVIVGGLLIWGVVSCGASMAEGARFADCMADARQQGLPMDEFTERDCREQAR